MREIKFRAWDKIKKEMVVIDEINFQSGILKGTYEKSNDSFVGALRNCDLIQFTGFFDKHGREIYEKDLLDYPKNFFIRLGNPILVEWKGRGYEDFLENWPEQLEIIGNIYEWKKFVYNLLEK